VPRLPPLAAPARCMGGAGFLFGLFLPYHQRSRNSRHSILFFFWIDGRMRRFSSIVFSLLPPFHLFFLTTPPLLRHKISRDRSPTVRPIASPPGSAPGTTRSRLPLKASFFLSDSADQRTGFVCTAYLVDFDTQGASTFRPGLSNISEGIFSNHGSGDSHDVASLEIQRYSRRPVRARRSSSS